MSITELLGSMIQSGMTASSGDRLKNALGGGSGGLLENLSSLFGSSAGAGGNMLETLSSKLGGASSGGGGLGGLLGSVLGEAEQAVGGKENLALGGLGALAGALMGGGGKSIGGALGGGVLALLGAMAYQALKDTGAEKPSVPVGLTQPKTESDRQILEEHAKLILRAMINAAKADGQIDQSEVQRIKGKLEEDGISAHEQQFIMMEMQKPMETEQLIAAVRGSQQVSAQLYAASLLAIEVDTPAEQQYLDQLATGLGLTPEVTRQLRGFAGF